MRVIFKNNSTGEFLEIMSPTMDVTHSGLGIQMSFFPNQRATSSYTFFPYTGIIMERTIEDKGVRKEGIWEIFSISDDIAYLWNINDVADVYEENFDDPELAPDKEEAETIIESVGSYDHVNHAVRMAILEEIKITLAEKEQ